MPTLRTGSATTGHWSTRWRARALLIDLDRTLVGVRSVTDYAAARRDAEVAAGDLVPPPVPGTDWTPDTVASMAPLAAREHLGVAAADTVMAGDSTSDLEEAVRLALSGPANG